MALAPVQPKTFLKLCQDLAREAGIAGTQNGNVPSTVAGQTGELNRVTEWVRSVWRDIQGRRHYNWMWEEAALTLPVGTNIIAGTIPVERYVVDTAQRVAPTTSDGVDFEFVPWDEWKLIYRPADILNAQNAPSNFTIRPDNAIVFDGFPTVANGGDIQFTIERFKNPTDLVGNDDVPELPADLADLIIYKALVRYANFDEAGVTRQTAVAEVARLESDLVSRCLPELRLGQPLC